MKERKAALVVHALYKTGLMHQGRGKDDDEAARDAQTKGGGNGACM